MVYVIKVKYGDILRRFTFQSKPCGDDLSYPILESKIRRVFEIPAERKIRVSYTDRDNDTITMADDQDLVDALIMQSLNPLRLYVTPIESRSTERDIAQVQQPESEKETTEVPGKQIMKGLSSEPMNQALEPFLRAATSPRQFNDLVEMIVKSVTAQVSNAVKGAETQVSNAVKSAETQLSNAVKSVEIKSRSVGEVLSGLSETSKNSRLSTGFKPVESSSPISSRESCEAVEPKSVSRVFHNGVQCDACGMCPIAGTRFKAIKKHDYDLCSKCFKDTEDQNDYTRIERPLFRPRHLHPVGHLQTPGGGRMRCPALDPSHHPGRHLSPAGPYASRPAGRWYHTPVPQMNGAMYAGKLDSRFVEDVTIMDGTEIAPGTRFTKIWRLRNSGKVPWAPLTKLVHVGGDELGSVFVVPLELPEHGLLPEQEVEAAVDLIAPEKPGRYVSHWRLASPAGPKFGHRVWVVIQVLSKDNSTPVESESVDSDTGKLQKHEANEETDLLAYKSREGFVKASHESLERIEGKITYPELHLTSRFVDVLEPISGLKITENGYDTEVKEKNNVTVADVKEEVPTENVLQEEVAALENSDLGGGFSMVEMPSNGINEVISVPSTPREAFEVSAGIEQDEKVEVGKEASVQQELNTPELLSRKLEAMGFTDRKLNVELLVGNKLDLRKTLDDLFAAAEWDPILEELEEMGFYDTEMNRRLMFKNNGSVKRVVKELVQLYKEPADQGKGKGSIIV